MSYVCCLFFFFCAVYWTSTSSQDCPPWDWIPLALPVQWEDPLPFFPLFPGYPSLPGPKNTACLGRPALKPMVKETGLVFDSLPFCPMPIFAKTPAGGRHLFPRGESDNLRVGGGTGLVLPEHIYQN